MTATVEPYRLELSTAEVYWLAAAFGYLRLPLAFLPRELLVELEAGQESLRRRGLILRQPGRGWQVDRLTAAAIQAVGGTRWTMAVERHCHGEVPHRANAFRLQEAGLFVSAGREVFLFTFTPDLATLTDLLLDWLDLPPASAAPAAPLRDIPQPLELVRAGWQDSPHLETVLRRAGLAPQEVASTQTWLRSLTWAVVLISLNLAEEPPRGEESLFLVGNEKSLWKSLSTEDPLRVQFEAADRREIRTYILQRLAAQEAR